MQAIAHADPRGDLRFAAPVGLCCQRRSYMCMLPPPMPFRPLGHLIPPPASERTTPHLQSYHSKAYNASFQTELKGHAKIRVVEKHLKQVWVDLAAANPNDPEVLNVNALYEEVSSESAGRLRAIAPPPPSFACS